VPAQPSFGDEAQFNGMKTDAYACFDLDADRRLGTARGLRPDSGSIVGPDVACVRTCTDRYPSRIDRPSGAVAVGIVA